jgi:CubicO group peptidase (beta-lactamase class C family)
MDEPARTGIRTDGLVIVRNGAVIYERYGRDWTASMPHLQWSATKSVAATMVGMAVERGLLDIDASICDTIEVGNPAACDITTRNLMEHSSGFAWRETYEGQSPTASSVVGMLYGGGMDDMSYFVTSHELRDAPGTSYSYSSGDTVVQTAVAHTLLEESLGAGYIEKYLFGPLGMTSAQFEVDRSGRPIGSSALHISPRDMARYGTFMLQDGCWGGERILPEGWMARATTPASSIESKKMKPFSGSLPGWNVWLNTAHPAVLDGQLPWPDAPEGTFAALGHWRQSIYVLPDHGIVVARTGDDRDGTFQHNDFLALVANFIEALPETEATEAAEETEAAEVVEAIEEAEEAEAAEVAEEAVVVAVVAEEVRGFTPAAFSPPALSPSADSVASPPEKYDVGLLRIGTSFAALHGCACRYIAGRSEQACIDYIRIQPDIAKAKFNDETQTVTARAFGMARTQARPGPDGTGCQIVD